MMRLFVATLSMLSLLVVVLPAEVQARQCKRICMDGQCWYDCSKIPGQNNIFKTFARPE